MSIKCIKLLDVCFKFNMIDEYLIIYNNVNRDKNYNL